MVYLVVLCSLRTSPVDCCFSHFIVCLNQLVILIMLGIKPVILRI